MDTPDLIVGVDFGMTYTGVAYASPGTASQTPRVIQRWSGRSHRDESKVPTKLVYNLDSSGEKDATLSSWGFECNDTERNDPTKKLRDWFKLLLENENLNQKNKTLAEEGYPTQSSADVTRWLEDYLRNIYRQTEKEISRRYKDTFWKTSTVVFIFSVPTTWSSHAMIERKFKGAILQAGFGSVGPNHTVELGLTEAEAAAVYTADAGQLYQEGEVILVCDAGGGTTDASMHKISSIKDRHVELDALLTVQGVAVGSTEIDTQFANLAQEGLQSHGFSKKDAEDLARIMMNGEEFQSNKCLFGDPDSPSPREYELKIPELGSETSRSSSRNQHRELRISCEEMRNFFDNQIRKICNLIDNLLDRLKNSDQHSEEVSKIVLSGGLGSSHYVRTQLASKYSTINGRRSNATRIEIVLADEPQLAVVKGLVINKLQRIYRGRSVLRSRCCRASYGIVCSTPWNKHHHKGQITVKNAYDGKDYAPNQISWLGKLLSEDHPIEHTFFRYIESGEERRPWTDEIASSKMPLDRLPLRADPQYIHCSIESDLTHIPLSEFKKKKFGLLSRGRDYYRVEYKVKVIIDPAHIRFELWYNGTNYTKDHPIVVEWGEAAMEISESPAAYAQR
ncbi:hypothetical protein MMC31_004134 [Peltigera leucophlebia]|nr:hypothetical protein [Peltigera leucophlebia]